MMTENVSWVKVCYCFVIFCYLDDKAQFQVPVIPGYTHVCVAVIVVMENVFS